MIKRKGDSPRITIIKWDVLFGDLLRKMIEELWPDSAIRVFHSGLAGLAALRSEPAGVGVFGLTLPDMDGLDLLAVVAEERLAARVLVVSGRRDERARDALRQARFAGYFDTECEGCTALKGALVRVADGQPYFSPSVSAPFTTRERDGTALSQLFSATEMRVFAVIGDGSDDQQASERLGVSRGTVHCHRQRIMRKLGVQTRTELMRVAIARGVIRITETNTFRPGLERELAARKARG